MAGPNRGPGPGGRPGGGPPMGPPGSRGGFQKPKDMGKTIARLGKYVARNKLALVLVQELGTAERYTAARPGEHTAVLVSPADMAVQGLLQELYHLDDDRGV